MASGTITTQGFSQEAFETFLSQRCEPAWLIQLRREAWKTFLDLPLPDRTQEEWARTDIRAFKLDKFGIPAPSIEEKTIAKALLSEGVDLGGSAVSGDSQALPTRLDAELARRGVLFGSLEELIQIHGELIRQYLFTKAVDYHVDKFAALHAACMSGGAVLYVPKGVKIEKPLHIFSSISPDAVDFSHTLIVLDEDAEATVLSETAGIDQTGAGLHCGAIEIFVGPRARLRYVNLQNWGTGVWHFAHQKALVDRNADIQWTIGALGSRLAKVNQHVALVGPGGNAQVNGVMFTEGRQHLSYHTLQRHYAMQCTSDLLYKGALQDKSRLEWRGMIKVDRDAQKTDGYQRNDNLILSEDARADSIPGLEIEADDVKCSHGATAGRVDDEQVFYARCRGLTRKEATRMIVTGFFQQVFDRITIDSVRHALGEAIGRRIREYN
ncbi:MAG: Fe-S cluster assembly protein SufD [Thermoguttaceae bacterium]|jgi:Fe-S cluster assembly protein SufD